MVDGTGKSEIGSNTGGRQERRRGRTHDSLTPNSKTVGTRIARIIDTKLWLAVLAFCKNQRVPGEREMMSEAIDQASKAAMTILDWVLQIAPSLDQLDRHVYVSRHI